MIRSWLCCTLTLLAGAGAAHAAEASRFRILHAEAIALPVEEIPAASRSTAPVSFIALGRAFDLELQSNDRLLSALPAAQRSALARYELYRGRIAGEPRSWVRLTRVGAQLQGMIWDGRELYVIEPARVLGAHLLRPLEVSGDAPVMYRYADTESDIGPAFCAVLEPQQSSSASEASDAARLPPNAPSVEYQKLLEELQAAAAAVVTGQMEVGVIGDFEFFGANSGDPEGAALARMNVVDGIFSDQVGVRLVFPVLRFFQNVNDGFDETAPMTLLNLFADHKQASADIRNRGVAHLLTGQNLDGTTVGIAFRGSICNDRFGVSLSQTPGLSLGQSALVIAHEIGHNFGAEHDSEAGSVCESTGPGFLMATQLNGSSTFSQCSLDTMAPFVDAAPASCISSVAVSDASVRVQPASRTGQRDQAFAYPIDVTAEGTLAVDDVVVSVTLPSSIAFVSGTVTGGSCASGGGGVTCTLGSLAGSSTRRIDLTVRGSQVGTFASTVTLTASNDSDAGNNTANVSLVIAAPATSGGGGGGGGALGSLAILLLLLGLSVAGPARRSAPAAR